MKLDHPAMPPFEPELREYADLVLSHGKKAVEAQSETLGAIFGSPELLVSFRRACHEGFQLGQRAIGEAVAGLEERARATEAEIKALRRSRKDRRDQEALLACIRQRQAVLRRLVDCILFMLIGMKPWIARRLMAQDTANPIDPVGLRHHLETAARWNAENIDSFALAADLTTIVDVCDFVRIEVEADGSTQVAFVELKEGQVNEELSMAFKDPDKTRLKEVLDKYGK